MMRTRGLTTVFPVALAVTLVAACSSASSAGSAAPSPTAAPSPATLPGPTPWPTGASTRPTSPDPIGSPTAVRPGEPWIVYAWFAADGHVRYLVRPDGTDSHRILEDIPAGLAHPDWSPDGKKLAFERAMGGDVVEVWTADADGTHAEKAIGCLQAPCLQIGHPAWSPDGSELAYVRIDTTPALGSSTERG
jgi:Tol biopolymer transport system component